MYISKNGYQQKNIFPRTGQWPSIWRENVKCISEKCTLVRCISAKNGQWVFLWRAISAVTCASKAAPANPSLLPPNTGCITYSVSYIYTLYIENTFYRKAALKIPSLLPSNKSCLFLPYIYIPDIEQYILQQGNSCHSIFVIQAILHEPITLKSILLEPIYSKLLSSSENIFCCANFYTFLSLKKTFL